MNAERRARLLPYFAVPAVLVLVALGTWQMARLQWKTALLATIHARLAAAPVELAGVNGGWAERDYRRVRARGRFLHDHEMPLLARTFKGQIGRRVITPLVLEDGRAVLVDRGWVPDSHADPAMRAQGQVGGTVSVEGVLRLPPEPGAFTPDNRPGRGEWYWLDVAAMARAAGITALPAVIEAGAAPNPGGLPIGGQTRLDIPNNHLQYALTWYSLAVILSVIAFLLWRRAR